MKNQRKYQKGITLIALVITIIVLLILAGVTLSIVFNGGIIDKSQNAVDKYSYESQNETEILDYMEKQFSQISGIKDNTKGTTNTKILEDKDYSYNNPVIPAGFKTSNEGASWAVRNDEVSGWNDGLVIEDSQGNQFVWVPVDGTNVTYGYHYDTIGSTGSTSLEQNLPAGIIYKNSDGDKENDQITEYGGFYIARYEAGIPGSMTDAISTASTAKRDVAGIPVSKKNQVPWNYISWSKAKENAASMYTLDNTNNHVQSTLITDRMWETTMQWLEKSGVDVTTDSTGWGNYNNSAVTGITSYSPYGDNGASWTTKTTPITKPTSGSAVADFVWLLKTGNTEYTSRKNIYDLAGNLWEWTNAKYSSSPSDSDYVERGGANHIYGTEYVAAYRYGYSDTSGEYKRLQSWAVRYVKIYEHSMCS